MNPILRYVLVGTASALAGAGISYLITKSTLEKKYETYVQDEVNQFKADYVKHLVSGEAKNIVNVTVDPSVIEREVEAVKANYVEYRKIAAKYKGDTLPEDADIPRPREESDDDEDDYDDNAEIPSERDHPEPPYIATQDEWMLSVPEFDAEELSYFEEEDILCAVEDGAIIHDRETRLGTAWMRNFGAEGTNDANVVYVINPDTGTSYEIYRNDGSYYTEYPPTPRKRGGA